MTTEKNYTGFAAYFAALGIWVNCPEGYSKGSAYGYFERGELVSVYRSHPSIHFIDVAKEPLKLR